MESGLHGPALAAGIWTCRVRVRGRLGLDWSVQSSHRAASGTLSDVTSASSRRLRVVARSRLVRPRVSQRVQHRPGAKGPRRRISAEWRPSLSPRLGDDDRAASQGNQPQVWLHPRLPCGGLLKSEEACASAPPPPIKSEPLGAVGFFKHPTGDSDCSQVRLRWARFL